MSYSAVVFDMDGTTLNTLDDLHTAVCHALAAYGLPERTLDQTRVSVGHGIKHLVECSVPQDCEPDMFDAVLRTFMSYYGDHSQVQTAPYPGIIELLSHLRARGIALGICTNKADSVARDLVDSYFPSSFDAVQGLCEGINPKPAPDSTLAILRSLNRQPDETVFVGDSGTDLATAANAGLRCIAVTWGFRSREVLVQAGATTIVDTAEELERAIVG